MSARRLLFASALALAALSAARCAPAPPRHLVLVLLDTLRADRMSIYGHSAPTTPFLVAHAAELVRFADAKAPAPWTLPSHASLFTALMPAEHRADWGHMLLGDDFMTLAEVLRDAGFCTTAITANPMVSRASGLGQGFEAFTVVPTPWGTKTDRILDSIPAILDGASRRGCRLFLFVNLMDTHIPYQTAPHAAEFGAEGPGPVRNAAIKWAISAGHQEFPAGQRALHGRAYDAAVRRLDDAVGTLVAELAEHGELERTLVVLTADHGEGLGSHPELGHEISVWEEQLRVPLLLRFPRGHRGGTVIPGPRGLAALAPSLLDWLAVARPPAWRALPGVEEATAVTADYRSYFTERQRATNRSIRERYPELEARVRHAHVLYCPPHKLVARADDAFEFYDLTADPEERRDVAAAAPVELRRCQARYRGLAAERRFTPFAALPAELPPEAGVDDATLRSLGYVD